MNYSHRIKKLQLLLPKWECDSFLIEDSINLFYLTGIHLSTGSLLLTAKTATLYVDGRYIELCQKSSPVPVALITSENDALKQFLKDHADAKSLGFDSQITSYKRYTELKKKKISLISLDLPLQIHLRAFKDKDEIACIRKAGELGSKGFDFLCSKLCKGISERELAKELEIFWLQQGARGVSFEPIIAFGSNSSMPHYRSGNTKLKKGDAILLDIGVDLNYYASDMTRMVYFGKPDPRMYEIHHIVQNAQKAALQLCKPGTLIGELDNAARNLITKAGYGDKFTHGLGHGVGLEIHEWPYLRNKGPDRDIPLQEGMVITIEPGIYLPGIGGVRIEDTVAITAKGCINITNRNTNPLITDLPQKKPWKSSKR